MLELIGQQCVGEAAGETHEMVGRDGRGYSYGHVSGPLRNQREQIVNGALPPLNYRINWMGLRLCVVNSVYPAATAGNARFRPVSRVDRTAEKRQSCGRKDIDSPPLNTAVTPA